MGFLEQSHWDYIPPVAMKSASGTYPRLITGMKICVMQQNLLYIAMEMHFTGVLPIDCSYIKSLQI